MFRIILALVVNLVSSGCAENVAVRGDSQGLASGGGGVAFGFHTADTQPKVLWTMTIARLEPDGRTLSNLKDYNGLPTAIRHSEAGFQTEQSDFAFYNLAPGDYVVAAIVPFEAQAQFHQPTSSREMVGAAITHGPLGVGVVGLMIAGEQILEERERERFGPRKPSELIFIDAGAAKENAPRFTVHPGQVTYIGDFLLGARRFRVEVEGLAGGTSAVEGENNEIVNWHSPVAEHGYSEAEARSRLSKIGVSASAVRTERLSPLDNTRLYYDPNFTRDRAEFRAEIRGKRKILDEDLVLAVR